MSTLVEAHPDWREIMEYQAHERAKHPRQLAHLTMSTDPSIAKYQRDDSTDSDIEGSQWSESGSSLNAGLPTISGSQSTNTTLTTTTSRTSDDGWESAFFPVFEDENYFVSTVPEDAQRSGNHSGTPASDPSRGADHIEYALDDTAITPLPSRHVDYLSHKWREEDLWASWKHVVSKRKYYSNGRRLENVFWRVWAQTRSNLNVISPESLNWLKDCDVTWLYGPLQFGPVGFFGPCRASTPRSSSFSQGSLNRKPILRKRTMSEMMLQGSLSSASLLKRAAAAVQAQRVGRTVFDKYTPEDAKIAFSPRPDSWQQLSALSSISSSPGRGERRQIHFNEKVEQFRALESRDEDEVDDDSYITHNLDSDSDDGASLMKSVSSNKRLPRLYSSKEPRIAFTAGRTTIAMLPSTRLNNRNGISDPLESAIKFRNGAKLSPSPSQETLRPSKPSTRMLLGDDDDDDGRDWQPLSAFANRKDSVSDTQERFQSLLTGTSSAFAGEPLGMRRTPSDMLMPYEEDEEDVVPEGLFENAVDTLKTGKDMAFLVWNYPNTSPAVNPSVMSLGEIGISPVLPNPISRMTETGSESKRRPVARVLSPASVENSSVGWNSGAVTEIESPHASPLSPHRFTIPSPPMHSSSSKLNDDLIRGIEGPEFSQVSNDNRTPDDQRDLETGSVNRQGQNASNLLTHPESNDSVHIMPEVTTNPELSTAGSCAIVEDIDKTARNSSSDYTATDADPEKKPPMDNVPATILNEFSIPMILSNDGHLIEKSIPAEDEIDENDTTSETYSGESDETRSNGSYYRDLCNKSADNQNPTPNSLSPILDPARQALVDRVMEEFWIVFDREVGTGFRECAGTSGSSGRSGDPSPSDSNANAISPLQRKRQRGDGECPEENDDRNPRPPRRRAGPSSVPGVSTRFACPFRKHNPQRYSIYNYRVCALSHWETIARVKEHLYRCHLMPIHCKRCWTQFKNQQLLDSHLTVVAAEICELKLGCPPDGITPEHERRLRSRKKTSRDQNDEDRWKDMYRLLFPNEQVPSSYFEPPQEDTPMSPDSRDLANYEDYIRRELPRLVRSGIEEVVRRETQPLEASLISSLVGIIQDCQDRVFRSYHETRGIDDEMEMPQSIESESAGVDVAGVTSYEMGIAQPPDVGRPSEFLDAVFKAPPAQSNEASTPMLRDDEMQHNLSGLTRDLMISDSGYGSELLHLCNYPVPCGRASSSSQCQNMDFGDASMIGDSGVDSSEMQWVDWGEDL